MTAGEFRDIDRDLLADYVGGALEGTPEHARVAQLIRDNPAWAEAYQALVAATQTVRAELAAWGAQAEPMPPDVAEQLTTVLSAAGAAGPIPAEGAGEQRIPAARTPREQTDARSPAPAVLRRSGARRKRRWTRWGIPATIAAGVAALAAFGVAQFMADRGDTTVAAPESAAPEHATTSATGPARVTTSGSDYTPATLPRVAAMAAPNDSPQPIASDTELTNVTPWAELKPLTDPAALAECLDEVTKEHAHGPIQVELVDFAAFEGEPALVVFFTTSTGERWAWVAGANCGRRGADTRYVTRVG